MILNVRISIKQKVCMYMTPHLRMFMNLKFLGCAVFPGSHGVSEFLGTPEFFGYAIFPRYYHFFHIPEGG